MKTKLMQVRESLEEAKKELEFEKYPKPTCDYHIATNRAIKKALFVFEKLSQNLNKILNEKKEQ